MTELSAAVCRTQHLYVERNTRSHEILSVARTVRLWYNRCVIELRLSEILEKRGRTAYWLAQETGIRYASIWKMSKGDTARLHIEPLDRICEALECQPGDLLVRVEKPKTCGKLSRKKAKKR